MSKYVLHSLGSKLTIEDIWYTPNINNPDAPKGYLLSDPNFDGDALLRTKYSQPLVVDHGFKSIFKYSWLPVHDNFDCCSAPITFMSKSFGKHLGLKNLYCTFSGYAPFLNAFNKTGSFKEYEAVGVLGRHGFDTTYTIVLASAGNTGRAFAELASSLPTKVIIVVPESSVSQIWTTIPTTDNIRLYYVLDGDYSDAIKIANTIASFEGHVAEGGVRNVGRRDGMGTTFISAVQCMNRIPDHYFQAVGSGSGALSAWESSLRFKQLMNTPGPSVPKLHISQNYPFTPIINSWNAKSPTLLPIDEALAKKQIAAISANVLSNRTPPYSTIGGVYDAMTASKGVAYRVTNKEAMFAYNIFLEKEQLEIGPSAAIACASLIKAVNTKQVSPEEYIMLNLTGGGYKNIYKDFTITHLTPHSAIHKHSSLEEIKKLVRGK